MTQSYLKQYTYIQKHDVWTVLEYPSLSADSLEDLKDLLEFVIQDLIDNNEPVPTPRNLT